MKMPSVRIRLVIATTLFVVVLVGLALSKLPFFSSSTNPLPFLAAVATPQGEPLIATSTPAEPDTVAVPLFEYIEVVDGCGPYFQGSCVNLRTGPGEEYSVFAKLRTGVVLRVAEVITHNGHEWYKIRLDPEVRYPERVPGNLFVAKDVVQPFYNDGDHVYKKGDTAASAKRIVIDISEQKLYAYDDDTLFMEEPISTGLEFTPTPRGTFKVYKMTPSRYMQGPIPEVSDQYYDLPGVPWNLYFTVDGAVIHGAYWHDHFGEPWSHGCVNLPPQKAKELYTWAEIGTAVVVQN